MNRFPALLLALACAVAAATPAYAETLDVPDVRGMTQEDGVRALSAAGLRVERVLVMSPSEYRSRTGLEAAEGTIVQQAPTAGPAAAGTTALVRVVRSPRAVVLEDPTAPSGPPGSVVVPVVPVVPVAPARNPVVVAPSPAAVSVASMPTATGSRLQRRGISVFVEPLFMTFRPGDTAFATEDPGGATTPNGRVKRLEWDYEFGIRGGARWAPQGSTWDLGIRAMWLEGGANATANAPPGGGVGVLLYNANNAPPTVSGPARAESDIELLEIDLTAGVGFDIGSDGAGRFFFGGRFATIDQSYDVIYDDTVPNGNVYTRNATSELQAFGAVVGFEGKIEFGSGFGMYGSLAGALMMGDTDATLRETQTTGGAGSVTQVDIAESFDRVIPVIEAAVGFTWQTRLGGRSWLDLMIAYEFQNWFNVLDVNQFPDDLADQLMTRNTTDLGLDGFIFRATVTF